MTVSSVIVLPAQPVVGLSTWVPLAGDGLLSPLGYYQVQNDVAGDVSGGNAVLTISGDARFTNWVSWVNFKIHSAAAAPDFLMSLRPDTTGVLNQIQVVGSMQSNTISQPTSSYLWTPPPILYQSSGAISCVTANVDATETYSQFCQIFCWDKNVTHRTLYGIIAQSFAGQRSPAVA